MVKGFFSVYLAEKLFSIVVEKDETKESGVVLEVLQKGYMYKDRVLRASMVKVSE
mgnify:CR=1 FL=1